MKDECLICGAPLKYLERDEWVILPVTNIGAYLGSSSLGRQYLSKIPPELMERKQSSFGASVYKMIL